MAATFDTNTLSQVQALGQKSSVSREYADLKRKQSLDERKRHHARPHSKPETVREERTRGEDLFAPADSGTKVDITV